MAKFKRNLTLVTTLLILLRLCSIVSCITSTLITRNNTIRDGDTLISEEEVFELGFFSPNDSSLRYVGIWYQNIQTQTIFWVANRERPLSDHNGAIKLADDGNLLVVDGKNNTVWSTNVPPKLNNTVAVLLETGDLVLCSDSDRDTRFWESFNNPTDTFLPGMRVRVNPLIGENHAFIPWKSETDPSPGRYSMGIDPFGAIEIVIWEGETRKWRSGQWNSAIFTGVPDMFHFTNYIHGFKLSSPPDPDGSVFLTYVPSNKDDLSRFRIRFDGIVEQLRWNRDARNWTSLQVKPSKECEKYNRCGNYSVCNDSKDFDSSKCSCIYGFEMAYQNQWNNGNFSGGCKRRVPLNCSDKVDGFRVLKGMKVPDFGSVVSLNKSGTCKDVCMRDCSCKAYEVVPGIGCMIWTRDMIDMEHFEHGGNSINIRLAASEIGGMKEKSKFWIIIFSTIGALMVGLCCLCIWILRNFRFLAEEQRILSDFSEENKLGQGGFGTVYKGTFSGGRDIAEKRLSGKSKQGLEEFKNEILLIAKLQHRNLVRLLGCCIENDEKILLYEYMPNNSLDHFLFGSSTTDKIRPTRSELSAHMVILAPEYAMEGRFSEKSDVYSFGVLIMEIVSGRKNISFRGSVHGSLIGYAWHLWSQGKTKELIDPTMMDNRDVNEAIRCIHVGMLCTQDSVIYRPNMGSVLLMLESRTSHLPRPRQPTFHSFLNFGEILEDRWTTPLTPGETVTLEVLYILTHSLEPFPSEIAHSESQLVYYRDSAVILSPYHIKQQTTFFKTPSARVESFTNVEPANRSGKEIKYGPYEDRAPYSYTPVNVHFENNSPFAVVEELVREIEISHRGSLQITENYRLTHGGARHKGVFSRVDYQSRRSISGSSSFNARSRWLSVTSL
ncbi:hypothetical protein Bca101_088553 [Brassica carinata]